VRPTLELATEWLREYARTYLPCNHHLEFCPDMLREQRIWVTDLGCFLRSCHVIEIGDIDECGACWIVEGRDCENREMRAVLVVHTQQMTIRVDDVERVKLEKERSNGAA
jgi:hypothetical protein